MSANSESRVDLVFEGGGVKGIALAGAFRELTDRGYVPQCVAGTSAGAINAALVAVGYTGAEVEDIVLNQMHFPDFADHTFLHHFGVAGDIAEYFKSRGMHSGNYFLDWITDLLATKGITTFGQLKDPATSPNRTYRLQVIASDLTGRQMLVLPRDAAKIGVDPDQLEIAHAVRMSMAIPFFFEPVTMTDHAGNHHVIVDGGLLSNYPIWLFDAPDGVAPAFPTLGMLLVAPNQAAPLLPATPDELLPKLTGNIEFLSALAETATAAHDRMYVERANFARTIPLPTLGVKTTEFDISPQRSRELFNAGKTAASTFFDSWDFETYKSSFRTPAAH